ncbi:MAG: hypothetical protein WAQ52_00375 [Terriglobales bacterium]
MSTHEEHILRILREATGPLFPSEVELLGHAKLSTAQIYPRVSVGRMMQTYNAAHPHAVKAESVPPGA